MNFSLGNKTNHQNHFSLGNKSNYQNHSFIGHKTTHQNNKSNLPIMIRRDKIYNTFNNEENTYEPKTFDYSKEKHNKSNSNDKHNYQIEKHKKVNKKEDKNKNFI